MKYCANCGSQLPDDAGFCASCGKPVAGANAYAGGNRAAGANIPNGCNNYDQYNYNSGYTNGNGGGITGRIRRTGSSTLFLILIICMAVSVVISLIAGGNPGLMSYNSQLFGGMFVINLVGCIPVILTIIGLFLFYFDCRSNAIPTGKGIGLYRAAKIINIVFLAITAVIMLLVLLVGGSVASLLGGAGQYVTEPIFGEAMPEYGPIIESGFGYAGQVFAGILIFICIVLAAVVVLAILLQAKLMKGAKVVRESLAAGTRQGTFPIFPVIIEIILAVGTGISMIFSLVGAAQLSMYMGGGFPAVSVIAMIVSFVQIILTILVLVKIRAAVNE